MATKRASSKRPATQRAAAAKPSTPPAGCGADDSTRLPLRLSPSRASDYISCPAKFYFKSILKMASPPTDAQVKGTIAHEAFEKVFDLPRGERTPEAAVLYVRPAWKTLRDTGRYEVLTSKGPEFEETMLLSAESLVRSWFGVEDPNKFDPHGRELKLMADIGKVPMLGIIDRVDHIEYPDGKKRWVISDYKSGKVPAPDDRYLQEKFFGLRTYAVLLHEVTGEIPDVLRLVYVAGGTKGSVRRQEVTKQLLQEHKRFLQETWRSIQNSAKTGEWQTKKQPLCQWCDHMEACPAWHPELAGLEPGDLPGIPTAS